MAESFASIIAAKMGQAAGEILPIEDWLPGTDFQVLSPAETGLQGPALVVLRPSPHSLYGLSATDNKEYSKEPLSNSHPAAYLISETQNNRELWEKIATVLNKLHISALTGISRRRVAEFEDITLVHPLSFIPFGEQINLWYGYEDKPNINYQPVHYAMVSTFDLAALCLDPRTRPDLSQPLLVCHAETEMADKQAEDFTHITQAYFLYLPIKCLSDIIENKDKYPIFLAFFDPDTYTGEMKFLQRYKELYEYLLHEGRGNEVLCFPIINRSNIHNAEPLQIALNIEEELMRNRGKPVQHAQVITCFAPSSQDKVKIEPSRSREQIGGKMSGQLLNLGLNKWQ